MNRFIMAVLSLCLCAMAAFAQSTTGRLVGTVSGPDGVIPGATVVIKDKNTGKEQTVVASGEGSFTVPQIEFGTYTVTITAQGFKTFIANDVKIDVGREYSLNPTLEVGSISENVTVVAGADIINTTNGEVSNTVSERQIQELPLNGRNPLNLIQLQAGTASNGATNTAINGQRTSFTNITRDGINVQDNFIRSNASTFAPERPSVDDVNEFTLTTQNAGADRGYGASQVQLVTPRGQSEFHGALFEYNRNSKFAANDFFNNASGVPRPFLNRNQFGFRLAGPVPVPHFGEGGPALVRGEKKLFFFTYYEGLRLRTSTPETRVILTPSARSGIFTFRDNTGTVRTANVLQLAGLSGIDPTVQNRFLANTPTVGNTTSAGDQLNTTGYNFTQKANTDRDSFTTRVDYEINSKNSIYGVFSYKTENNLRPDVDNSQNLGGGFSSVPVTVQPSTNKFLVLAYRLTPTASLTNDLRGGFFFSDPIFQRTGSTPAFFVSLPLISNPEVNFQDQGRFTKTYNLQDNADYTRGKHSIRFGGQAQWFRVNPFGPGAFGSSTIPTLSLGTNLNTPSLTTASFRSVLPAGASITQAQVNTANALLGLLGGIVTGSSQTFNATSQTSGFVPGSTPSRNLAYENYSLYIADQYRVTPRLTLNLGVRYEAYTGLREPNGLALEPVIPSGSTLQQAVLNPNGTYNFVGGNAGGGNKFFRSDKNNFAPIVSFAYSPQFKNKLLGSVFGRESGRTVIRGGYRISYVNDEFVRAADNALGSNAGLSSTASAINPLTGTTGLNARLSSLPSSVTNIPTPTFQVPLTYAQNNIIASRFGTVFAIDPNLQVPRTEEYNLSFERELGFQTALEIRYVGGRSNNLVRGFDYNQVDIFNNGFLADFNRARANLVLTGNPACTSAGCQPLTVFPRLVSGGLLNNATIRNNLLNGTPADLAITYVTNNLAGGVQFLPNPNTGVADVIANSAKYRYNSLQVEVRRRFAQGLSFQANYTFQKTLTNASGVGQTNFEPLLDLNQPQLEYARADYDQTHVFNFNALYELPFGKGKRFLNGGGAIDRIFGGFQLTSIIRLGSGAPITIVDPRGTLNRAGRSGRQTPVTSLTKDQIKSLIGIRRTPCGVFFIDPSVINYNLSTCSGTGRASEGFGTTPFPGQVFFNAAPGQTGNLERAFINGPTIFNWDASIIKNIHFSEKYRVQLRAEAFNVINRVNFFVNQFGDVIGANGLNINSPNFGRVNATATTPRILQFAARFEF